MSLRRAIQPDLEAVASALLVRHDSARTDADTLWPDQAQHLRRILDHLSGKPAPDEAQGHGQVSRTQVVLGSRRWRDVASMRYGQTRGHSYRPAGPAGLVQWRPDPKQLVVHARYVLDVVACSVRVGAALEADTLEAVARLRENVAAAESALRLGGSL